MNVLNDYDSIYQSCHLKMFNFAEKKVNVHYWYGTLPREVLSIDGKLTMFGPFCSKRASGSCSWE